MNIRHTLWPPLLVVALALPPAASGQEAPPSKEPVLSDTGEASCLVKITCDPQVFPLSQQSLQALVNSAGISLAASRSVFRDPSAGGEVMLEVVSDSGPPAMEVPGGFGGGGFGGGGFGGGVPGGPMGGARAGAPVPTTGHAAASATILANLLVAPGHGAVEYLKAVTERLEAALVNVGLREREQLEQRLQSARAEAEAASDHFQELQALRREFCERAGRTDLAREAMVDQIRHLEQERLDLEMERVSREARREAIEKRIAQVRESPDPRVRAATEMLKAAGNRLETLREKHKRLSLLFEKGTVSQEEVLDAQAQVAQAEAQVAETKGRLEEVSDRVAEFNQHLAEQGIEEAEMAARLHWLEERLARAREALALADEYERTIEIELPLGREAYAQSRILVAELERRKRLAQLPAVTVLGE